MMSMRVPLGWRSSRPSRSKICLLALGILCISLCIGCQYAPFGLTNGPVSGAALSTAPPQPVDPDLFARALDDSSPFSPHLRQIGSNLQPATDPRSLNRLLFLENGENALLARLHLIEMARSSIDLQTFIWANDESGRLLAEALLTAARRGVKVRILIDYVGLEKDSAALAALCLAHPNLTVHVYRPTAGTLESGHLESLFYAITNFKGANQRMHNKILVVDKAIGITGGRNVENSYFDHALGMNFKDRDALVAGPAATQMARSFQAFWDFKHTRPAHSLRDVAASRDRWAPPVATAVSRRLQRLAQHAGNASVVRQRLSSRLRPVDYVEFVSDVPGKNGALHLYGGGRATAHVVRALEEAENEIWIQSPYLVLEKTGQRYFQRLRERRPDLRIHISTNSFGSTDNLVAYAGNVRSRDRYLHKLDFRIGEFRPHPADLRKILPHYPWLQRQYASAPEDQKGPRPPFLCVHSKSFVVDDDLAYVGTYNLDPRSANLNTECGLLIRDSQAVAELKGYLKRDLHPANCWVIAPRHDIQPLIDLQMLAREVTDLSPIDLTILDASSAYELKPGQRPVDRDHPQFYERFEPVGSFPGSGENGVLDERDLKVRLLKHSTPLADPLL